MELRYWLVPGKVRNNRINLLNEKRSLIPWGLRVPIWKIIFCSRVLRLSVFPRCRERLQTAIYCLEWLGRSKCLESGLDVFWSSFSTARRCSQNRSPSRLPVSLMYTFLQRVQVIQWMTLTEVQVKWSVIVMDRLGPDNFSTLQIKGYFLHCARAYLKVSGWSLVWNALLTKKLPVVLSRYLNEINGSCENILSISGSFSSK